MAGGSGGVEWRDGSNGGTEGGVTGSRKRYATGQAGDEARGWSQSWDGTSLNSRRQPTTATADADAKVASCHGQNAAMATVAFTRRLKSSAGSAGLELRACRWVVRGGAQNFSPHNRLQQSRAGEGGRAGISVLNPISAFPDRPTSNVTSSLMPHPHHRQPKASWWFFHSDSGHRLLGGRYFGRLSLLLFVPSFLSFSLRLDNIDSSMLGAQLVMKGALVGVVTGSVFYQGCLSWRRLSFRMRFTVAPETMSPETDSRMPSPGRRSEKDASNPAIVKRTGTTRNNSRCHR